MTKGKKEKKEKRGIRLKVEVRVRATLMVDYWKEGEGVSKNLSLLLVQETPSLQICDIWMVFTRKRRGRRKRN